MRNMFDMEIDSNEHQQLKSQQPALFEQAKRKCILCGYSRN